MNKAQDYIERNIVTARNNPYTLAIVYLALVQRGSSAAPTVREYLFEKAIREGELILQHIQGIFYLLKRLSIIS